jgi:hypothetical protein
MYSLPRMASRRVPPSDVTVSASSGAVSTKLSKFSLTGVDIPISNSADETASVQYSSR